MSRPDDGGGGTFSGMKCAEFSKTVKSLQTGAQTLKDTRNIFSKQFGDCGISTEALDQLATIGNEVDQFIPEANRRLQLGLAIQRRNDPWLKSPGNTTFVAEPPMSIADARKHGKDLADRFNKLNRTDGKTMDELHKIALELQGYAGDPEVAAAFFAGIQPPNRLTSLPSVMYASGGRKTSQEDLKIISMALGEAISSDLPGMDKIKQLLTTPGIPVTNWDRLALLQYGRFPADFVRQAAQNLALTEFGKNQNQDWRGGNSTAQAFPELSPDNVALALNLLGNNPEAARQTIVDPDQILAYVKKNGDVAPSLARYIEGGSGLAGEEPGKHSPEAVKFALSWMIAAGSKDLNPRVRDAMAKVAGSYKDQWPRPDGDKFAFGPPTPPDLEFDDDFPFDPNARPTAKDEASWSEWQRKLHGGQILRPGLDDALAAYSRYTDASGAPLEVDYGEGYKEDKNIKLTVDNEIISAQQWAEKIFKQTGMTEFPMTGLPSAAKKLSGTGYATDTENWQKTLGNYQVWSSAVVTVKDGQVTMRITVNAEDMYNFNRDDKDIATGAPDNENGRFSTLGWAKPFRTHGSITKTLTWPLGQTADPKVPDGGGSNRDRGGEDRPDGIGGD
ncbi:hypothetical protein ACIBG8_39680 [Nonomuraea sp. NPDC050556]|uniref:hypothetical protein n=1 Tax=Nonomuraea sp. NPDC050556 TaxID=3364369 RepID=UPI00379248BB